VTNTSDIPYSPRTGVETYRAFVKDGWSKDSAFIIAARTIGAFPYRCSEELPALVKAYEDDIISDA